MFTHARKTATVLAVVGAAGLGGGALAGAASTSSNSSSSSTSTISTTSKPQRAALSSENAAKVKAAALEKVPDATVLRTEAGGPYSTPYHAHIRTSGGTPQVVAVDADFNATTVQADNGRAGKRHG